MKDYLHLMGGLLVAILLLAMYIFCWGALMRCYGDGCLRIQNVADEALSIERPTSLAQSGETFTVKGTAYVTITLVDWERLTNAVARLEAVAERRWKKEHETAEGRMAWHGNPKREVSEDGRTVIWNYPDGYTYTEQAKPSRRESPAVERTRKAAVRPQGASAVRPRVNVPPRLRAKQEAISARPASKEVNATFGPGGKVLKVEGGK